MCLQNHHRLDTKILIETLLSRLQSQDQTIERLITRITVLEAELAIYKNKKNSNNSHTPASKDENRPLKNQSLREKIGRKPGGQPGHEAKPLSAPLLLIPLLNTYPNTVTAAARA